MPMLFGFQLEASPAAAAMPSAPHQGPCPAPPSTGLKELPALSMAEEQLEAARLQGAGRSIASQGQGPQEGGQLPALPADVAAALLARIRFRKALLQVRRGPQGTGAVMRGGCGADTVITMYARHQEVL